MVIDNFLSPEEVTAIRKEQRNQMNQAKEIVMAMLISIHG